ncbi:MAG: hypothetical protein PHU51_01790 [Candidatus Nanoarchaeia archaeon]|nr:hypothetical protein [Candidatus Nanoarchaeia archaeon]
MSKEYEIINETETSVEIRFKDFNLDFLASTKNNFYRSQFNDLSKQEKEHRDYLNCIKPKYYAVLLRSNL